jgi:hypothetical protein
MSKPTAADLLDRAADLIEQRGYCRGVFQTEDGRLCAIGALRVAYQGNADEPYEEENDSEYFVARGLLRAFIGGDPYIHDQLEIALWSDATDASTVIATLRAVAAKARGES